MLPRRPVRARVAGDRLAVDSAPRFKTPAKIDRLAGTSFYVAFSQEQSDQFSGALGFASVISLPYLLDQSEDMFAAAVDGDPGTPITQPE